jgi:hypothetical protein
LRKSGERILFFDEFTVSNRPNTYDGWAEKNTRPEVSSDESKNREKLNGLLEDVWKYGYKLFLIPIIGLSTLKSLLKRASFTLVVRD